MKARIEVANRVRRAVSSRAFTSDSGVIALAASTWAGASWPHPWSPVGPALALLVAFVVRRPLLLVLASAVLAATLAAPAIAGAQLEGPGRRQGIATLVTDPVMRFGARCADVSLDRERFELCARGAAGRQLAPRRAGERIDVEGAVTPRPPDDAWMLSRHLAGRWQAEQLEVVDQGAPWWRAANAVQALLARGAQALPSDQQALFTGFVVGDDRGEDPAIIDDYRASGLSHLLAVSGENVAFVVLLLRPLLQRIEMMARLLVVVGALAFFTVLTRAEPSVLRATFMVGIAAAATTFGRRLSPLRALGLTVVVLILVDPLLVRSVGFQLSVGASLGIIVLARPIGARLRGPRWLVDVAAVTIAAQIGVAPIEALVFGGLPLVAVPANVLAAPAAGPIMVWGLTAGMVAGVVGGPLATLLHLPTRVLLWWVTSVAAWHASLPVGELHATHLVALVVIAGGCIAWRTRGPARTHRAAAYVAASGLAVVLIGAAVVRPGPPPSPLALGAGAQLWVGGDAAVLVVDGRAAVGPVLAGLRRAGVRSVPVVVARSSARATVDVVRALVPRLGTRQVVAPRRIEGLPASVDVPDAATEYAIGTIHLQVQPDDDRLEVDVRTPARPGAAGAAAAETGARH